APLRAALRRLRPPQGAGRPRPASVTTPPPGLASRPAGADTEVLGQDAGTGGTRGNRSRGHEKVASETVAHGSQFGSISKPYPRGLLVSLLQDRARRAGDHTSVPGLVLLSQPR